LSAENEEGVVDVETDEEADAKGVEEEAGGWAPGCGRRRVKLVGTIIVNEERELTPVSLSHDQYAAATRS
jgi:hypothetical protein